MVFENPKQWAKWLHLAEWWYNTNYYTSLKTTPFEALYGYPPTQLPLGSLPHSGHNPAGVNLAQRQHMLQILKDNLTQAQSRMKFCADKLRSERTLAVGDLVYLKLQPYRQSSVDVRKNVKLSARYYSPYKILQKIGTMAYLLELPSGSQLHLVFHVSQLKKRIGPAVTSQPQSPTCDDEGRVLIQPIAILKRRMVKIDNGVQVKVLIQWANLSREKAS
uniref:Tf2-1-like SH3-like domain-containing protein n=2 Tax=Nicotiana TaxID=4085 RepID=A0A1S4C640_TOBAC|nr:PREDICTED: uncharacterized protein LOC104246690 [Nicotiana sylvestris]XP_016496573.1 PREDICTED: uncharacterized protein LOC107815506 [Nicotiana tabacum]